MHSFWFPQRNEVGSLFYTRKMQLFTHRNKKERNIRAKVPFEDFCTVEILYNRYGICSNKRNTKPFEDGTWGAEVTKKTSVSINICIKYSGANWETAECVIHRSTHIQPHALTSSYILYKKHNDRVPMDIGKHFWHWVVLFWTWSRVSGIKTSIGI